MEQLTYAQLVKKHGGSTIVRNPGKIMVASLIMAAYAANPGEVTQHASASSDPPKAGQDLRYTFILTTAGANQNDQFFVEDELLDPEVYLSPVGEPINEDHEQTFKAICGEIHSSIIVPSQGDRPLAVKCGGLILNDYPKVIRKVHQGAGRWATMSMEALPNPLERVGKYLVIHNPKFVGAGLVRFPGNKFSQIEEVSGAGRRHENSDYHARLLSAGVDYLTSKR